MGTYTFLRFLQFYNHEQPQFIVNTVLKDMYNEYPEPFNAGENFFQFAVGFMSIRPFKFIKFDPRYGQMQFRRVELTQSIDSDEIVFERNPYELIPCDPEKHFIRDTSESSFKANMDKFMCINTDDDLYFQGTLISPVHNYLHFEILACSDEELRKTPGYE